jgi:hypothetical protein
MRPTSSSAAASSSRDTKIGRAISTGSHSCTRGPARRSGRAEVLRVDQAGAAGRLRCGAADAEGDLASAVRMSSGRLRSSPRRWTRTATSLDSLRPRSTSRRRIACRRTRMLRSPSGEPSRISSRASTARCGQSARGCACRCCCPARRPPRAMSPRAAGSRRSSGGRGSSTRRCGSDTRWPTSHAAAPPWS